MSTGKNSSTAGAALDAEEGDEKETLGTDDVFHLLQNSRRRGVLRYVRERPDADSFEMRDIAERVAAWEQGKPIEAITSTERQRVYIALYQSHLPKLDEHGVIEYDQSRGTVRVTSVAEDVCRYLDVDDRAGVADEPDEPDADARDDADEATRYYGGATVVSLVLTAATWVGLVPTLLASSVGAVVTSIFAAVTLGVGLRQRPL